jgi:hypothetical protein
MRLSICLLAATSALSATAAVAHADSLVTTGTLQSEINFNAQAVGQGKVFTGQPDSPLTIGIATFTGGQLLENETRAIDRTGVYATFFKPAGTYSNPLNIAFSTGVTNFRIEITNNFQDLFKVSDNLGDSTTLFLLENQITTFSLSGIGITNVTVQELTTNGRFDFAIDNVHFDISGTPSPVPEPSSIALLGTGVLGAAASLRRRLPIR